MRRVRPLEDRLWEKVREQDCGYETPCWVWTASTAGEGYGSIGLGRQAEGKAYTHRVAYELIVGKIPDGLTIDHLCRNRRCCNPAHLETVTQAENNRRGNGWSGRNHRKTHCKRGHPLSGDNLGRAKLGRECRACHREREYARKRRLGIPERGPRGPYGPRKPKLRSEERSGTKATESADMQGVRPS
jgi:hypothetical protein